MTTKTDMHGKIEKMAEHAKDSTVKAAEKIVDASLDAAHAAAEKTREQTKHVGEKVVEAGEKILKLVK